MDDEDSYSMTLFKPGMTLAIVANCVIVKCDDEDDAIVLQQLLLSMVGKQVIVQEEGNA